MALTKARNAIIANAPVNVVDFGADPTGASDSTAAIQAAINAASFGNSKVIVPAGTYSCSTIYFYYDASLNAGFNPSSSAQGRIIFEGFGQCDDGQAITDAFSETGTSIVFSGTNGLVADKAVSPYPIRGLQILNMTLVGNSTGSVVYFNAVHTNAEMKHVTVVQKNKDGNGITWLDSYMLSISDTYIINTANAGDFTGANTITGNGLTIKNPTLAAGQFNIYQTTVQGFSTGYQFGEPDYLQSAKSSTQYSLTGVQALKCDFGFDFGKGVANVDSDNIRAESCVTRGARVHAFARNVSLKGRFVNGSASQADIVIGNTTGFSAGDTVFNVQVVNCAFTQINSVGILVNNTLTSEGLLVENCQFVGSGATPTGVSVSGLTLGKVYNSPRIYGCVFESLSSDFTGPIIRDDRRGASVDVKNNNFALDSNSDGTPDNWVLYSGTGSIGTGVDPYGTGSSYMGSNGSGTDAPIYQVIYFPTKTVIKISYWVKEIANAVTYRVRLTEAGSSTNIQEIDTEAPSSTAEYREFYYYNASDTSVRFEIRGAEFGMVRIEDVTN